MPNFFEKYSAKIHALQMRVRGNTVTFSPAIGDPIQVEVGLSYPDPDGQRPTSQIVDIYAELARFPLPPANFDQFTIKDQIYIVYATRVDETGGVWINCRRA